MGGMAEVRDAWDHRLHRAVAIKILHPALNAQPDIRARFVAEARAAAGLAHPNVVAVHDFGEHDGTPFLVMERLGGDTLEGEMGNGPLPDPRVRSILEDVLAALSAAHSLGILHRDVKPGNVLCSPTAMKVADFGIAKTIDSSHTVAGQVFGTMAYMSPERLMGAPATPSDDLYAVGVLGYEAATGSRLFPQTDPAAIVAAVLAGPPSVSTIRPDIDRALAVTIDRAMARDPRLRFTSADDMRHSLATSPRAPIRPEAPRGRQSTKMFTQPVSHPPPTSYATPARIHQRRSGLRVFGAVVAALLAVVVTAIAIAVDPSSRPSPPPTVSSTTTTPPTPIPTTTSSPTPTTTSPDPPPPGPGNGPGNGNGNGPGKHNKHRD